MGVPWPDHTAAQANGRVLLRPERPRSRLDEAAPGFQPRGRPRALE